MTAGRLCLECAHCYVDAGSQGYSEYTPGSGMTFYCQKRHRFTFHPDESGGKAELLADLRKAEKCADFKKDVK